LGHLENQLKLYKLILQFKIARIPKYFRPYAELHFKKASQNDLPDSVRNNEKHIFHHYHRLGYQQWYVNRYKTILTSLLQNLEFHMKKFEVGRFRYENSSEDFYNFMYNECAEYESENAFSDNDDHNKDLILESAFGAQVTFIDDNNNVVTIGDDNDATSETNLETNTLSQLELSNIAIRNSNSDESEGESIQEQIVNTTETNHMDTDDQKPAALPLELEDNSMKINLLHESLPRSSSASLPKLSIPVMLPQKIPINANHVSNDDIMKWLEKQNPRLADSFANEFKLYMTKSVRSYPKSKLVAHGTGIPVIPPSNTVPNDSMAVNALVDDLTKQYQELNEEGQKDLWLGALASNDTNLIQALTNLRLHQNTTNSKTQLAKLTKDLLTHSEKHKVNELWYEVQAGRRRLYFHNWLTRISAVIKMFSQTAPVLDANNGIIEFTDPNCIGNQALYMLISSKIDNFYRNLIQRQQNRGDKALSLLKSYCASCTFVDKSHFHREFTNLRLQSNETATHFLKRFTIARTNAIIVDNDYSED
jgi:hypothetical protein